jgi:hypothetical protein
MNTNFRAVLIIATAVTYLAGGGSLYLANQPKLNPAQQEFFETLNSTWKTGTLAIFALLAFRQLPPRKSDED